jgi:hypothetical protein
MSDIVLREYVRTMLESSIDTVTKALECIPALPHPILQYTPPVLLCV